jgi:hypothetical protein
MISSRDRSGSVQVATGSGVWQMNWTHALPRGVDRLFSSIRSFSISHCFVSWPALLFQCAEPKVFSGSPLQWQASMNLMWIGASTGAFLPFIRFNP